MLPTGRRSVSYSLLTIYRLLYSDCQLAHARGELWTGTVDGLSDGTMRRNLPHFSLLTYKHLITFIFSLRKEHATTPKPLGAMY
jgi:hypothetical protein